MAILQNIRVKFGVVISVIIALALLSFIIDPSTLETALQSMSKKYDVGQIAGKRISYTDFQEEVDKFTKINELMTGSTAPSEETRQQIYDAAWQSLLDKNLFVKNANAAGIKVGEDEMVDLTSGEHVSPLLAQNQVFHDETGTFSVDNLVNFVQSIDMDQTGTYKNYWDYLQNTIYTQQFYTKYGSLFAGSDVVNPVQLERALAENNVVADIEYVMKPFDYAADSTLEVSGKEITDYYNSHKNFFLQNANRDAEYVVFEVRPSDADVAAASSDILAAMDEFSTTTNMRNFLTRNSDRAYSEYWYKDGDLITVNTDVDDFVSSNNSGVSPVYNNGNSFFAARIMDRKMVPDSVYVRHILLQGTNARSLADSLMQVLAKGGNFSSLAAEFSTDQSSAADGELGNIGWMTQSYMIPGFESVITAQVRKPFVLNTQYGTHVVEVTRTTKPVAKKQVAILEKTAIASRETFNEYYAQANRFATIANGTLEGYLKAVDSLGVYSHPASSTLESTSSYGAIDQAKEVTRWIFDAKEGKASNIITVNNNYFFIVALKKVHDEGYMPLREAAGNIRMELLTRKRAEKLQKEIAEKIAGMTDMQDIADALETEIFPLEAVSFSNSPMTESVVLGAASALPVGQIGKPVAGSLGVYVVKVNDRHEESFYTEEDARNYETQKAQYASQMILPVMSEEAEVKDHRARFF